MNESFQSVSLSPDEVELQQQFRALRTTHDLSLRDRLVCKHLHLVQSVTRRFSGLGESLDDMIQEGSIGLLQAVDLYDPDRGVKFSTYACHLITSHIQHYLRDRGRLIRQPAWIQELNSRIVHATEKLTQELGRDPELAEVATRMNLTESSIKQAMSAREINSVISLSAPEDGVNEQDFPILDKEHSLANKLTALQLPVEDRIVLDEAIVNLKTLEQQVIRLFFFEDLNQTETARRLGISVNYSSYLLRRAINKIRAFFDSPHNNEQFAMLEAENIDVPTFDRYTGLYTEAYLRTRIAEEISRERRYPTNFALMLTEVSGLDSDENTALPVIVTIGQFFRQSTRIIDMTSYIGNSRFALLLPHTGREARVLGQRLAIQVPALFSAPEIGHDTISLHIGFAIYPIDGTTVHSLFARALAALSRSKHDSDTHEA